MPLQAYQRDLQRPGFQHDPAQERAVREFQRLHDELAAAPAAPSQPGLLTRLFGGKTKPAGTTPVRGLYLWGGVGRGKTYLMDTFYQALDEEKKLRLHFHRFMRRVHDELKTLRDQENPLAIVAERLAAQTRIICLDEFFVSDITDAMLLGGLLQDLFDRGVSLVTTSNIPPDELYQGGLQRARFLPAIELIKRHMTVFHLDSGVDYRLRYLETAELYHYPLDENCEQVLENAFANVSPEPGQDYFTLDIEGRPIPTRRCADGVVWFEFTDLCDGPRGQRDYIEISRLFHTVLLGNTPVLTAEKEDPARRFITLIDEFYDRRVKLIMTAAAAIDELYQGKKLRFEFQRTVSRLKEMQSLEYLGKEHLP